MGRGKAAPNLARRRLPSQRLDTRPRTGSRCPTRPSILSKQALARRARRLGRRPAPLGLRLEAGEAIADIVADLPRLALIELVFPKFSDGRAFSTARLLREKHGYSGELRAVGNVLSDQIPFMRRVGFDTFEVTHAPTRRALIEGRIPEVVLHYQPAAPSEPPRRPPPLAAPQSAEQCCVEGQRVEPLAGRGGNGVADGGRQRRHGRLADAGRRLRAT